MLTERGLVDLKRLLADTSSILAEFFKTCGLMRQVSLKLRNMLVLGITTGSHDGFQLVVDLFFHLFILFLFGTLLLFEVCYELADARIADLALNGCLFQRIPTVDC